MKIFNNIRNFFVPSTSGFLSDFVKKLQVFGFFRGLLGSDLAVNKQIRLKKAKEIYSRIIRDSYHSPLDKIEIENIFLIQSGVLVFYHVFKEDRIEVLVMLFESSAPKRALWNDSKVITEFENKEDEWKFVSLNKANSRFEAVWRSSISGEEIKIYPKYRFTRQIEVKNAIPLLKKHHKYNPMIKPKRGNHWESFTTFNPAAFYAADKVHILYRAQGFDYVSQVGYAVSKDGFSIDSRFAKPIYKPTQVFEGVSLPKGDPNGAFVSGGGCGGVEDPRTTVIDDRIYMTYVAYDGWNPPRIALTSIALDDFLNNDFLWEKPVLISPPGIVDKSAVIFPEKINGKYVIMHRVFPDILIDYVDSLDFNGDNFLEGQQKIEPRSRDWWDSRKIGAGAPPLKTDQGWLLIYQAVDDKDASEYKVGAMLLDLEDPSKVIARSAEPILLPREEYENVGFKAGVVYPCGAVIKDKTLFVYYGGADSYVCVATADLNKFVDDLKKTGGTTLDSVLMAVDEDNFYGKN